MNVNENEVDKFMVYEEWNWIKKHLMGQQVWTFFQELFWFLDDVKSNFI